jgi:hypothetical protein
LDSFFQRKLSTTVISLFFRTVAVRLRAGLTSLWVPVTTTLWSLIEMFCWRILLKWVLNNQ